MRLSKAWIVASKDFKTFFKHAYIIYSIAGFEIMVGIGMPILLRFIANKTSAVANLTLFIPSFSFWFVIGAALVPVSIASYSLVGEKIQKSLEPLLATPTTDAEILAGKSLAAFIPAMAATYLGAILFMLLVNAFTASVLSSPYFPNGDFNLLLFVLAPLACLFSVGYNVLISSRSNDVRSAQQLGALILLPFGGVYVLSELKVITLNTGTYLIIAAILAALDVIIFFLVRTTFRREEILTKWK